MKRSTSHLFAFILTFLLLAHREQPFRIAAAPQDDHTIKITILSNLRGRFLPDESGQGGLPAFSTYVEREKIALSGRGSLIVLHSGDFTGESDPARFLKALRGDAASSIPELIGFDAIGFSPPEANLLIQGRFRFERSRAVSITSESEAVKRDRIVVSDDYTVYATSITEATEPRRLQDLLEKKPRAFLTVILDGRGRLDTDAVSAIEHALEGERTESPLWRTLYILSGAERSSFYRMGSGMLVCAIAPLELCEIEFRLRGRTVLSVQNRIQTLNGKDRVHSTIPQNRSVHDALSQ